MPDSSLFSSLSLYYHFFRNRLPSLVGLLLLDFFSAAFEMVPPLFAFIIFDYAIPQKNLGALGLALGGGAVSYLIYFLASSLGDYFNTKQDEGMSAELATDLFKKIEQSPLEIQERLRVGDLTVRLNEDVDTAVGLFLNLPSHLLITLVQLTIFFFVVVLMDPWILIPGILAIPLYLWETKFFSKKLGQARESLQTNQSDLFEGLQEKIANLRTIKAFNRLIDETRRLGNLFKMRAQTSLRFRKIGLIHAFLNSSLIQIWMIVITGYLSFEVIRGRLTLGEMITLAIYLPLLQEPLSRLSGIWSRLHAGQVSLRRVNELFRLPAEEKGPTQEIPLSSTDPLVELKEVSFGFDGLPILNQMSLKIHPHHLTAVVGPSGIGKSTLVHLLLRMYEPQSGKIFFKGRNLAEIGHHQVRQQMGVVFQETSLFSGTIRSNILYGKPQATEKEMIQASQRAQVHSFIESLPNRYSTELLAWGKNFSMGERKRIALARTLLLKPSLLILDEVTSSLDAESELLIKETLGALRQEITILFITHQLSAVKHADRILFLGEGKILEEGTFQELMTKKQYFFDLYNTQMGGFQEFQRRLEIEMERHVRYKESLSLAILQPKEQTNHPLMESLVRTVRKQLRVMDFCSLYAENRLVIALPQTNREGTQSLLERIVNHLQKNPLSQKGTPSPVTFQWGVASCSPEEWIRTEELFAQAEKELTFFPKVKLFF